MLCRALADVAEWREWFELLARRSLARQAQGLPTGLGEAGGDERATPTMGYWRWGGTYLTRCAAAHTPTPTPTPTRPLSPTAECLFAGRGYGGRRCRSRQFVWGQWWD